MSSERRRRAAAAAAMIAVLACTARAQQPPGTAGPEPAQASDSAGTARLSFDKLFSTHHWRTLVAAGGTASWVRYDVRQRFNSSLVRTVSALVTDEEDFRASFAFLPGAAVQPRAAARAFILSDRRGLGLSDVSSYAAHAGFSWRPAAALTIEPMAGARADRQSERTDRGVSYLVRVDADTFEYAGYAASAAGSWEYNRLDPRTIETGAARIASTRSFPGGSRNSLEVRYYRNRRDFYTPADPAVAAEYGVDRNIETRAENLVAVTDSLLYAAGAGLSVAVNAGVFSRGIGRKTRFRSFADPGRATLDTEVDELTIGGEASAAWAAGPSFDARITLVLQERSETHRAVRDDRYRESVVDSLRRLQERRNNVSRRTSLGASADVRLSAAHAVAMSASGSILRYDTPGELNTDDRDDLLVLASVTTRHRLSRTLSASVTADASLSHLVYLSGRRSADNAWNRIFRLSPRIEWSPAASLTTSNRFEVLANYTVYDFEAPGDPVRSFSFRHFVLVDSTSWRLTRRTTLLWSTHVRLYERGTLRWSDFSERPVNSFEEFTHAGTVRYAASPPLIFSLGIRYFSQMQFDYAGDRRVPRQFLRSVGPATGIEWTVSGRTMFAVGGWYERQTRTGLNDIGVANFTMSLTVSL